MFRVTVPPDEAAGVPDDPLDDALAEPLVEPPDDEPQPEAAAAITAQDKPAHSHLFRNVMPTTLSSP
jgi:hypothetical protein